MDNTGRILRAVTPTARRITFGDTADASIDAELEMASRVDLAHLVMLAERGIVDRSRACTLLRAIERLRALNFAPLRGKSSPRGLFLLYEDYLVDTLGPDTGGILQTARSRNDLNATVLHLRLRGPYLHLIGEALRLQAVLLRRAGRYRAVVMPAYTHYQAAVPVTYGHYLSGVAQALERDVVGLVNGGADLERSPLGAGAVGGTSLPIDQARTAWLLGFDQISLNSIDAVASRDLILRLLASMAIMGATLSRLAADLLLWATSEFGFISLPDELVGSSSMMPQKRNPYLLEHVEGRSASALGAFVSAVTAMHAKPFTNSIAVGTEAVSNLWKAWNDVASAATLTRLVVAGARPRAEEMAQKAIDGFTAATEVANRLMVQAGMPFRLSHRTVGAIVREAFANGDESFLAVAGRQLSTLGRAVSLDGLDPASIARVSNYGGGPGGQSFERCLTALRANWRDQTRKRAELARKWSGSKARLDAAVRELCGCAAATAQ